MAVAILIILLWAVVVILIMSIGLNLDYRISSTLIQPRKILSYMLTFSDNNNKNKKPQKTTLETLLMPGFLKPEFLKPEPKSPDDWKDFLEKILHDKYPSLTTYSLQFSNKANWRFFQNLADWINFRRFTKSNFTLEKWCWKLAISKENIADYEDTVRNEAQITWFEMCEFVATKCVDPSTDHIQKKYTDMVSKYPYNVYEVLCVMIRLFKDNANTSENNIYYIKLWYQNIIKKPDTVLNTMIQYYKDINRELTDFSYEKKFLLNT